VRTKFMEIAHPTRQGAMCLPVERVTTRGSDGAMIYCKLLRKLWVNLKRGVSGSGREAHSPGKSHSVCSSADSKLPASVNVSSQH